MDNSIYIHIKSGKMYWKLNTNTLQQIDDEWVQGKWQYESMDPTCSKIFQRTPEEFQASFVRLDTSYIEVIRPLSSTVIRNRR